MQQGACFCIIAGAEKCIKQQGLPTKTTGNSQGILRARKISGKCRGTSTEIGIVRFFIVKLSEMFKEVKRNVMQSFYKANFRACVCCVGSSGRRFNWGVRKVAKSLWIFALSNYEPRAGVNNIKGLLQWQPWSCRRKWFQLKFFHNNEKNSNWKRQIYKGSSLRVWKTRSSFEGYCFGLWVCIIRLPHCLWMGQFEDACFSWYVFCWCVLNQPCCLLLPIIHCKRCRYRYTCVNKYWKSLWISRKY